jgi:RHS repeat-associated protein
MLGPASTSFYFHTDHQGSVLGLSDEAGLLVNQYSYDSYGRILTAVEAFPQPFRFTGQQLDLGGKLYYYKHRHYDPETGRFLQEDPLWAEAGDLNTYRYAWNDPVNWTDPLGLAAAGEYGVLGGSRLGHTVADGAGFIVRCLFNRIADAMHYGIERGESADLVTLCDLAPVAWTVKCPYKRLAIMIGGTVGGLMGEVLFSFEGDTPVLTKAGLKKLKEVQVGEEVAAWDKATGAIQYQKVTERYVRKANQALKVTVRDTSGKSETFTVTPEHPFLTPSSTWHAISGFKVGDQIASATGTPVTITAIETDATQREVYNLQVEEDHSYAVGELGAWSHNVRNHHLFPQMFYKFMPPRTAKELRKLTKKVSNKLHKDLHSKGSCAYWRQRGGQYNEFFDKYRREFKGLTANRAQQIVRNARRHFNF